MKRMPLVWWVMSRSRTAQTRVRQLVSPGKRPITLLRRLTSPSERSSRLLWSSPRFRGQLIAGLPAVGWLSSQTVLADGDGYAARGAKALRGETELVVELARPIAPDADDATVRNAIAGLRVALEIVDVTRPPHDAREIIEGNLFH